MLKQNRIGYVKKKYYSLTFFYSDTIIQNGHNSFHRVIEESKYDLRIVYWTIFSFKFDGEIVSDMQGFRLHTTYTFFKK
jgi:hypothetical protein